MSENAQITLDEAKKLYNSSEEAKVFLLSKFTKDELEGKNIPSQEEFNKFFEEHIFTLIDYSKTKCLNDVFLDGTRYISKVSNIPTSRIRLKNSNDWWLFDYNYDQKNQHFYYSYDRVYDIVDKRFSLKVIEFEKYMKIIVEKYFNLTGVIPVGRII